MKVSLGLNGIAVACEKGFLILDEYLEENSHRHAHKCIFPSSVFTSLTLIIRGCTL